ncbi:hypothetical protein [Polymorphospora rubra]|uniref:DNRLRE domain-containing protein n=1 Tax=Polymorphospora rubra TaxID=338584 RepID=A0A810MW92_9ACTN|nr:hypothetical protein [Polymorphospora rubra]BCJ65461.1 hypothetical protein Prubr_24820 [Polymorphospora rubra]
MTGIWPRRGLIGGLALTLAVTGLAVVTTGSVALASPHNETPPIVQLGWTDSATPRKAYDAGDRANLPLGTWQDDTGKSHTSRVYATFDLSSFEGKKIYGGTMFIQEYSAADCGKRAMEIWRTRAVDSTPTWRRAPQPLTKVAESGDVQFCPAHLTFDVGAALRDAAAKKQRRVTFEIRVPEQYESDASYGRHIYWSRGVNLTVQYNSPPKIDNTHLYNGGFACTQLRPYPKIGGFAHRLQAVGTDADPADEFGLTTEYAIWPRGDAAARTVFTRDGGRSGRVNGVTLPEGTLVDGVTYGWQARVGDGAEVSAWSKKCFFTYDATRPSTPTVTSANYPPSGSAAWAPVGEPAVFTFSGNGDRDVAGFEYSWNDLGATGCSEGGAVGQLVCRDPFSYPNRVRADVPGGSATIILSPNGSGPQRLTVRAVDLAGNVSPTTEYQVRVPSSTPEVLVESGEPEWGQEVRLKFVPADGITGVQHYEVILDSGQPETRQAAADGTAEFSFVATNPGGHRLTVRSHSGNGFVSEDGRWFTYFDPWPGVRSDIYLPGQPTGGVGVEGTFTFSPPPGWTDTVAYRYVFGFDPEAVYTEVAAGVDGRATITWTPTVSGFTELIVYAVRANGTVSEYSNWYSFAVAATS